LEKSEAACFGTYAAPAATGLLCSRSCGGVCRRWLVFEKSAAVDSVNSLSRCWGLRSVVFEKPEDTCPGMYMALVGLICSGSDSRSIRQFGSATREAVSEPKALCFDLDKDRLMRLKPLDLLSSLEPCVHSREVFASRPLGWMCLEVTLSPQLVVAGSVSFNHC